MNIGIIIQARLGSTRLPRKVLREFYSGWTLLDVVINNLKKIKGVQIIVATSDNANDDELSLYLKERGITVYRGSEDDVLNRFIGAAEENGIDGVVRICSDNPFLDWHGVNDLINSAKLCDADYIGFRINGVPSIKTHFGFWGEFVKLDALKRVCAITNERIAHEHVTIYIYTHPEVFKCLWIDGPRVLQERNDIRLTVDNEEDFFNAQKVYSALNKMNSDFGIEDVVKIVDNNQELLDSMKIMIESNNK